MERDDWGVEIVRTDNGFLIKDNDGKITVVEDNDNDELSSEEKLLWKMISFFNLGGNQFNFECLSIVRTVGDEYTLQKGEQLVSKSYQQVKRKKSK